MAYSKSYSKTTRFSSMGGKTRTIENTYMIEKKNKSARFIKGIRVGNKSRSIAGYTPDGKKIAILSQKKNGNKVRTNKYVVNNPKNLKTVIRNAINMSDIKNKPSSRKSKSKRSSKSKGSSKRKRSSKRSSKSKGKRSSKSKSKRSSKSKRKSKRSRKSSSKSKSKSKSS